MGSKSSDEMVWGGLERRLSCRLRALLRWWGVRIEDVPDLIEETYVKILEHYRDQINDTSAITALADKIARNLLIDQWRREKRTPVFEELNDDIPQSDPPLYDEEQLDDIAPVPSEFLRIVPTLHWTSCDYRTYDECRRLTALVRDHVPAAMVKRTQRLRSRVLVRSFLNRLWDADVGSGDLEEQIPLVSPHLRGGPIDMVLRRAPAIRSDDDLQYRLQPAVRRLIEEGDRQCAGYVSRRDRSSFTAAYSCLRIAATLSPAVARDAYPSVGQKFDRYRTSVPLVDRLLRRFHALTGDPDAIERQLRHWHYNLKDATNKEALESAAYYASYVSGLRRGQLLLKLLIQGDEGRSTALLSKQRLQVRSVLIQEAYDNLSDPNYRDNEVWAENNWVRMHFTLGILQRDHPYSGLTPIQARRVARVAEHAFQMSKEVTVKRATGGIVGQMNRQCKL